MTKALVVCLLLGGMVAEAAEVCVTIPTAGWTTRQRAWREGIAYRLLFEAGQNVVPTVTGETLCVANPTVDVPTVLTGPTLLARMARQEADNATEAAALEAAARTRRPQLKAFGFSDTEIDRLLE